MQPIVPYLRLMRLDKPIGIWLLFFPAAWGVLLSPVSVQWLLLGIMLLGAVLIRSAGCIINDMTDRKLDQKVARTQNRPLASGAVSRTEAIVLLLVLLFDGLLLCLVLPRSVLLLALIALPFIAAYPWMKRLTWWPQAFLGLTFNFGAIMGWAATGMPMTPTALFLYAACFFWTLGYDTIYAVQDMNDDAGAGIKSSARRVGISRLRGFTLFCYGTMLVLFSCAVMHAGFASPWMIGFIAVAAIHGIWQASKAGTLSAGSPVAGMLFRSNQWFGLILLTGLVLQRFANLS